MCIIARIKDLHPLFHRLSMPRRRSFRPALGLALLLPLLPFVPMSASAQMEQGPRFGLGYVVNAPDLMAGGSTYVILPALGGIGLYVDAKLDIDSPSGEPTFVESLTAQDVEDQVSGAQFRDSRESWRGVNVALVRPVNAGLILYGGLGYAERNEYKEYRDPEGELGLVGVLVVEDPDARETKLNGMVGAFLRISSLISLQTGFETTPKGFTVGASFRLPPR
jgi:hypothetical protein